MLKTLLPLLFPSIKAAVGVFAYMFTIVSAAYLGMVFIAKSEAQGIESRIIAVRSADMEHLDKRFDDTHAILKEIKDDIRSLRK